MSDRCRTIKGVHIPGCMGGAVYGHSGCTCPSPSERKKDLDQRVKGLEYRLSELEKFVHRGNVVALKPISKPEDR